MSDFKKVDAKKMLKRLGQNNVVMRYNDRLKVEVKEDTQFYKKGDILNPHSTFAQELIGSGIAKEVK